MNTSEIKPLHLALPRTRAPTRQAKSETAPVAPARPVSSVAKQEPPPPPQAPIPDVISQTLQPTSESPADIENRNLTDNLLKTGPDFWFYPLGPSALIKFLFTPVSEKSGRSFRMLSHPAGEVLLTATVTGKSRSTSFVIYRGSGPPSIADGQMDTTKSAIYVTVGPDHSEAACWAHTVTELIIPAIKKIEGKSRMVPIPATNGSALFEKASQKAKEAIRLKSRDAAGDRTFGGKFERESPANFQLFHESNSKRTLCSLGAKADGNFLLEIAYPLSTLQGFIAAICATVS